ncbi:MAG: stage III sporulation protein AC [Clostridia bacterium]|nr:stage III sporulation protein AC [Clostridia bacterium]
MDLVFKIAGIGVAVAVLYQVLSKAGREDQAALLSLAGLITVLLMLVDEIRRLFETLRSVFRL